MGRIDTGAWVAPSAIILGDVTIGAGSRILHGAVVNGDRGPVVIGADVVVMEQALLRGRPGNPLQIGDAVLVGPHTHLNGTRIEDEVFVATGVSMFPGSVAGVGSELRINSVLHVNSILEPGTVVPIGWIAAGNPAELFSPDRHPRPMGGPEAARLPGNDVRSPTRHFHARDHAQAKPSVRPRAGHLEHPLSDALRPGRATVHPTHRP